MEFFTSLNYFRPRLRDLLPHWTISDLIYGIRYLILLTNTEPFDISFMRISWGIKLIHFIYELSWNS